MSGSHSVISTVRSVLLPFASKTARKVLSVSTGPSFKAGDDVRHAKYGDGVVLDVIGLGENAEIVVRFPDVGEKRLLLGWAPLEKI